ncbi:MAG: hypothetical protein IPK32_22660 [Verrucomicrobiaceae bacterium]|nr:hypothetical protein [Verrucomicrobiaceae bacterium]
MNSADLDDLITRLEDEMPDDPGFLGIMIQRHDWRPIWALIKEIQAGFSGGVRYPTKPDRESAWKRFCTLRNEASRRADLEKSHLRSKSEHHRDYIMSECRGIGWSSFSDAIFFFDQTSVEQMKRRAKYLTDVMRYFSEHKHEMLGQEKQECHERIQEVKEEHERFWEQNREAKEAKRDERAERCRANLERNREKYEKASGALERLRDKASDLRSKI